MTAQNAQTILTASLTEKPAIDWKSMGKYTPYLPSTALGDWQSYYPVGSATWLRLFASLTLVSTDGAALANIEVVDGNDAHHRTLGDVSRLVRLTLSPTLSRTLIASVLDSFFDIVEEKEATAIEVQGCEQVLAACQKEQWTPAAFVKGSTRSRRTPRPWTDERASVTIVLHKGAAEWLAPLSADAPALVSPAQATEKALEEALRLAQHTTDLEPEDQLRLAQTLSTGARITSDLLDTAWTSSEFLRDGDQRSAFDQKAEHDILTAPFQGNERLLGLAAAQFSALQSCARQVNYGLSTVKALELLVDDSRRYESTRESRSFQFSPELRLFALNLEHEQRLDFRSERECSCGVLDEFND